MRKQGFSAGTSLALSLRMHERNKAVLLSLSKQYVSTNEYRLNRQTCSGIQSVRTPDLNSTLIAVNGSNQPSFSPVTVL